MAVNGCAASPVGKLSPCTVSVVADGGSAATILSLGCSMEVTTSKCDTAWYMYMAMAWLQSARV